MGSDSFFGLRRWHRAAELPFVAPLIVASRPGQPLDDLMSALPAGLTIAPTAAESGCPAEADSGPGLACMRLKNFSGAEVPLYFLTGLDFDVSASQVREQIRAEGVVGQTRSPYVPAKVMNYIRGHELYR